jgi:thiol-disulfide isomerase/thioredoxin
VEDPYESSKKFLFVSVVPALLSLDSFSLTSAQQASQPRSCSSPSSSRPALTQAPDFTLRDANGGFSTLAQYRGGFVLLNFWATWCGPCREEMPSMEQLSRSFAGQGLAVVAINQRESAAQVNRFMKTHALNFPTPLDTDGRVAASYRAYGVPVSYLIDGSGQAIGMESARLISVAAVRGMFPKLIGEETAARPRFPALEPQTLLSLGAKADGACAGAGRCRPSPNSARARRLRWERSGAGEFWYMVKTKGDVVGWVRGTEVE